jgi:hypothetical protein
MQTIENYSYDKKGFLGAGSFGSVYKAKNIKTGEIVALKSNMFLIVSFGYETLLRPIHD